MRKLREIGGYVLVELEGAETHDYGYRFGVIKMDAYTGDIGMDHGYMEYDGMDSFDEAFEKLVGLLKEDAGENQGYRIGCLKGLERESMIKAIDTVLKGMTPPPEKSRLIYTCGVRSAGPSRSREQCHSRTFRRPYSMRPCSDFLSRRQHTHNNRAARTVCRGGAKKDLNPLCHVRYGVFANGLNGFVPGICDQGELKGDVPDELGRRSGIIHSEACGDFCYDLDTGSAGCPILFLHMLSKPRGGIPAHAMIRKILTLMSEHSGINYAHFPVVLKENGRGYVGIDLAAGPNGGVPYSLGEDIADRKTAALVADEKGIRLITRRGDGR